MGCIIVDSCQPLTVQKFCTKIINISLSWTISHSHEFLNCRSTATHKVLIFKLTTDWFPLSSFSRVFSFSIDVGECNVNDINTSELRNNISYVTQETFLFTDTIENNIRVAKADATREEIIEAAKNRGDKETARKHRDEYTDLKAEIDAKAFGVIAEMN